MQNLNSTLKKFVSVFMFGLLVILSACDADPGTQINSENATNTTKQVIEQKLDNKQNLNTSGKHTLWTVKGKQNTLYLLGSIHVLKPELYPLPEPYQKAYADAENLVFEIDESIMDPALARAGVQEYAALPAGSKLVDVIGDDDYAEIKRLAKENKVPMMMIEPFDPWFSTLTLVSMQYLNAGLSPEYGIDQHFMKRALKDDKPVSGLETMGQQFSFFDSMSLDTQTDMLIETLKGSSDIKEMANLMITEWREGDMEGLNELLMEDFENYEDLYDILLKKRNLNWIEQFQPMLADTDDYLVVVGAAHMLGKDGVVKLLRDQGYQVTQQ